MSSLLSGIEGLFGEVPAGMTPAVQPFSDPVDLVNDPAGQPAQERWPGAVDPSVYTNAGPGSTNVLPQQAAYGSEPFSSDLPPQAEGGGYQDTSWLSGTDAPTLPWDSSAGAPFAPSGPVDPELHSEDTGGVYRFEHVTPAEIGTLTRHTGFGQTYNRVAATQSEIGLNAANGRTNMNQDQHWNPDGHSPWEVPYAERPVYNNVAYEAMPVEPTGSIYTPSGGLPNRSPYDAGAAMSYEAPADPYVGNAPAPNAGPSNAGWLLG